MHVRGREPTIEVEVTGVVRWMEGEREMDGAYGGRAKAGEKARDCGEQERDGERKEWIGRREL